MDFCVAVIVVVSLISAESAIPAEVHDRLDLLETQVNTLETQISLESNNTQEFYGQVEEMNNTLNQLQNVCQHASTRKNAEIEDTGIVPFVSYEDAVERVLAAFNQEKIILRSTADTIDDTLEEIKHNMTKETDRNIQTVINDYTDLKHVVQNIISTLIDLQVEIQHIKSNISLQAEIQQYITSDKENTALLTAELKELVSRLGLIEAQITKGANYNKVKQDSKHMGTSIDTSVPKTECPNSWSRHGLFCYRLFKTEASYLRARQTCEDLGAFVVDIQNNSEQIFVADITKSVLYYWIGITDIKDEGSWKWHRTNEALSYTYWFARQPDNTGGIEHCAYGDNRHKLGEWNDYFCTYATNFVCKKSL